MSVIHNVAQAYPTFWPTPVSPNTSTFQEFARFPAHTDSAEFSGAGQALARAVEESSLRLARVRAIRTAIANGTYETPKRIEGTARHLLNVLA